MATLIGKLAAFRWIMFFTVSLVSALNVSYTNPMLPGWHSDPSCIHAPSPHNYFFCATSSFLTFPGHPVYASSDMTTWRLASHALSRPSQFPRLGNETLQNAGFWAPTLRYHNGVFYLMTSYTPMTWPDWRVTWLLFNTTDPFRSDSWSDPIIFDPVEDIDPDLFWDDDGTLWAFFAGIRAQTIDPTTGALGNVTRVWNGTTGVLPEGPHVIKRDGWYYLLISEGGTELGHSVSIARSKQILGPYESYEGNPILTNKNTTEYFQTVGHSDLFHDSQQNWWGAALATRSGPEWLNYPMGRETVLFPVTWEEGDWPILQPVRGKMNGWARPPARPVPGEGPYLQTPDVVDFEPGTGIPKLFLTWRFPREGAFTVSPPGKPNTLRLLPSRANLTSSPEVDAADGKSITLLARVQEDTLFGYSVDVELPSKTDEDAEVGVTAFLTQLQHVDLGIVTLPALNGSKLAQYFRFRVTGQGNANATDIPETTVTPVPAAWLKQGKIRLYINAVDDAHFAFAASPANMQEKRTELGRAPTTILSGGNGPFTGTLLGVYATTNGKSISNSTGAAYVSRWRYEGRGQRVRYDDWVPYSPLLF